LDVERSCRPPVHFEKVGEWQNLVFELVIFDRHRTPSESLEDQMRLAATVALASFLGLMALSLQRAKHSFEAATGPTVEFVVESKIHEAWQDFKTKDADAYAALLDDHFIAVQIDGKAPHNKNACVAEVVAGTLNSYSRHGLRVIALGANAALATYTVKADGVMPDGKIVHSTIAATEVWVRRAVNWKTLRYHESEIR
jgi:ketosteroid isomerase-like protein